MQTPPQEHTSFKPQTWKRNFLKTITFATFKFTYHSDLSHSANDGMQFQHHVKWQLNTTNIKENYILLTAFSDGLLTQLLTPFIRVLLEKLTSSQLVKKFPTFCGAQMFITTFTNQPPWNRLLPENLTVFQSPKQFPTFYGIWRFHMTNTRAHHFYI
jgi:hypothetical protein